MERLPLFSFHATFTQQGLDVHIQHLPAYNIEKEHACENLITLQRHIC